MRKSLRRLQREAQHDLAQALKRARSMMNDDELTPRDRLDAMEFIRRCSGIDKAAPPAHKRPGFSVVRAPAAELAAAAMLEPATETPPSPTPRVKRI